MMRYQEPVMYKYDREMAVVKKRRCLITGTWTFQLIEQDSNLSQDQVQHCTRKGGFWAWREQTPQGYVWRVALHEVKTRGESEVEEEVARAELHHLEVLIPPPQLFSPDPVRRIPSAGIRMQAAKKWGHRELMGVLKEELESLYGQAEEMHAVPLPREGRRGEPWWSGGWGRLARIYGKATGGVDRSGGPGEQAPVGSSLQI